MDAFPEGKAESDGRKAGDGCAREVARRTRARRSMAGKKYVAGKELPDVRTMKSAASLQLQGLPADMKEEAVRRSDLRIRENAGAFHRIHGFVGRRGGPEQERDRNGAPSGSFVGGI